MKFFGSLREAARVMKKSVPEAAAILEADQSHDQIETALRNHLRANRVQGDGSCCYRWLRAVYDTFFVWEQCDDDGVDHLYRADYALADDGTLTVSGAVEVRMEVKYVPLNALVAEAQKPIHETRIGVIQEKAIRADGTALIKLIDPGVGSSGYYSADVLKAACEKKVIPAGTQMFANHMTEEERASRPEGDVTNLTAVTREDARWMDNGPDGPGAYANSQIFSHQQPFIEAVAEDIGVSLDGIAAISWGEVNGVAMPIIEELLAVSSVDFVTRAGRGGKIVSLQEAARDPKWIKQRQIAESKTEPASKNPQTQPEPQAQEEQMTEAEAKQMAESQANRAVENYKAAQKAAREAVSGLALPDGVKNRIVEAQTASIPVLESGALDVATLTQRAKDAAAIEATFARENYNFGDGQVQNGASSAPAEEAVSESKKAGLAEIDAVLARLF